MAFVYYLHCSAFPVLGNTPDIQNLEEISLAHGYRGFRPGSAGRNIMGKGHSEEILLPTWWQEAEYN